MIKFATASDTTSESPAGNSSAHLAVSITGVTRSYVRRALFFLAVLSGYGYVLLWPWHPYPMSYALKATPLVLIALAWWCGPRQTGMRRRDGVFYTVALLFSAVGDVFLDLDRAGYLRQALLAFLVAQVAYICLFWPRRHITTVNRWFPLLLLAVCGLLLRQFYANAGALWWPLVVYVFCLGWMALAAFWSRRWPLMAGGLLFLCADALIGINRFWLPFEHSTPVIVSLYISAQLLLAYGLLFGYLAAHRR